MALGDTGDFFRHPFTAQQLCAEQTVANIRLCTEALNAGGVGHEYPDVVKHGCSLDFFFVESERVFGVNFQCEICHTPTVA